ncbi:hypothetical protein DPMN_171344 [Dreissena polymorpha]|uniref:Uncharacterized protein n=1 Tax=Dreissena polymorpha TaxID=45954 RepID=A0A9D4DXV7_DREPO|nr:hypothetical protein DPMN_171344 [Dreissena polymorpha]
MILQGSNSLPCLSSAQWSTPPPVCIAYCGNPPNVRNATVHVTSTIDGGVATYSCMYNYMVLLGNNNLRCLSSGLWSTEPPICKADCGQPPGVANASLYLTSTRDGGVATYTSNCGQPPTVRNATVQWTSTQQGGVATYTCMYSYMIMQGSKNLTCLSSAQWSAPPPVCIAYCGNPPNVRNATVHVTSTSDGGVATYSCIYNYMVLLGNNNLSCLSSGQWSTEPPICKENVSRLCNADEISFPQYKCVRTAVYNIDAQIHRMTPNVTTLEVLEVLSGVANVTENESNHNSSEVLTNAEIAVLTNALDLIANLVLSNTSLATKDVAESFLQSTSNIIGVVIEKETKGTLLPLKQANENTSETLFSSIDNIGSALRKRIAYGEIEKMVVVTKNIAFEVKKVVEGYLSFPENYFQNYTNNDTTWILQSKSGIFLNTSKLGDVVATIVIYKNLTDVISARSKFNRSSNDDDVVNGPVMSCSISNVSSRLASPIILTFEHGQTNFINASCNYWKFSSPGYWSSDGCIVRASNDTITVCECDHLTNFAVLMSHFVEAHVKSNVLRLVSIVGLSLSTFCLLLTIIILAKLWRYVRSDRFVVLLNLILALIISYAIFIGGVNRTENKVVCTVVAASLHYICTVVFCLMLAEGIGIARDVIKVFASTSNLRQLLMFAWGLPVLIVGTTLAITKTNGYGDDHYCWLSLSRGLRWAFVAPALFVILFNVIVLILLFKKMFSLKAMVDKQIKDKIKKTLWSLCVLVPLLGVSWILGIFYVNESASFMQYVFAVCNGLQGVYIFVFNCILNGQVKNGFKTERIRRKNKSMASSFSLNMSKDSTRERRDCDTPVKCASVPGRPSNQMEHITKRETSGNQ